VNIFQKVIAWFDGKKTWTGAALVALPAIFASVAGFLTEVGAQVPIQVFGAILLGAGIVHKVVKFIDDLTPDSEQAVAQYLLPSFKFDFSRVFKIALDILLYGRSKGYWSQDNRPEGF
jgi:hypothetical protein